AFADLRSDDLHPLREFTGQHFCLVLRGHLERTHVAEVRIERDGRQRDDGEEEKRDDEAKAEAHGVPGYRLSLLRQGYVSRFNVGTSHRSETRRGRRTPSRHAPRAGGNARWCWRPARTRTAPAVSR